MKKLQTQIATECGIDQPKVSKALKYIDDINTRIPKNVQLVLNNLGLEIKIVKK